MTVRDDIFAALPAPGTTVVVDGIEGVVRAIGVVHNGDRAPFEPVPAVRLYDGRVVRGTAALYLT